LTRLRHVLLLLPALLLIAAGPDAVVAIRAGDHPGFSRLVVDLAGGADATVSRDGDRVVVALASDRLAAAPRAPRNVVSMSASGGQLTLVMAPGAQLRQSRIGGKLVLDVLDPGTAAPAAPASPPAGDAKAPAKPQPAAKGAAPARKPVGAAAAAPSASHAGPDATAPAPAARTPAPPTPAATPTSTPAPAPTPSPTPAAAAPPTPAAPPAKPAAPQPAQAAPESAAATAATDAGPGAGPVALMAQRVARPARGFMVPFGATVGAAAFRRGSAALVVFDEKRPVDLAALRDDSIFGSAAAQVLGAATVIRVDLPPEFDLHMARTPQGWAVTAVPSPSALQSIVPRLDAGRLAMPADAAGAVVAISDPDTGSTLLVGTQRGAGQGMSVVHRAPEFTLLPTWQGVAVEPLSDRLALRADKDGFVLATQAGSPALALEATVPEMALQADAASITRRFDLRALPAPALQRRLQAQIAAAAAAPPLARLAPRKRAAEAMLALGQDVEAQTLLQVAAVDDPHAADDPDVAGLSAIAALLAHRMDEAAAIEDPQLNGSDEIALWRAVRLAELQEGSPAAAAEFAATAPLILAYPEALRARIAPLAAETMARNGEIDAARRMVAQRKGDPVMALADAMLKEADHDVDGALAGYDALAEGRDRLLRMRAASRAVELRLAARRIDDATAADALEKLLFAWRGDDRELALRLRVAQLRENAGAWRAALTLLRETETQFPEHKDEVHAQLVATFDALLQSDSSARIQPLDLAALADENADLIPPGAPGDAIAAALADKLIALDLPNRAAPLLAKMMSAAPPGPGRAGLGARLAELRLAEGDASGALTTLADSGGEGVPPELAERRTLVFARAAAKRGDLPRALAALSVLDGAAADATRADLLEQAKDWPGAVAALNDLAALTVPAEGPLDVAQQRTLLRLASAAAQASDAATLARLHTQDDARMADAQLGQMFRLLTAEPVNATGDLPRSARETAMARSLPKTLEAIGAKP
jgi:hypothetical protein